MNFKYCSQCGNAASEKEIGDEGNIPYCENCKKALFPFSYTCILTLIVDEYNNFALIQQNNIPNHLFIGVAGYLKQGDTLESAVKREILEEVGLSVEKVEYVKSYFYNEKDLLMVGFVSYVKHSAFILSCEVDNAEWFSEHEAVKVLPEGAIITQLFMDYMNSRK